MAQVKFSKELKLSGDIFVGVAIFYRGNSPWRSFTRKKPSIVDIGWGKIPRKVLHGGRISGIILFFKTILFLNESRL